MKETITVLKALKGMKEMHNFTEAQIYFTDEDGYIIELRVGIDEAGDMYKVFDHHDSEEDMQEAHDKLDEEEHELYENTLLN